MIIRPAKSDLSAPQCGSFALVTYLPDPVGSFLTELRQMLPGDDRPEAHITFLPPRPLLLPIDEASAEIRIVLDSVQPFSLELGGVKLFAETNMLYLAVESGCEELQRLHASLNSGALFSQESFEFIPHLTLSGHLVEEEVASALQAAERAWAKCPLQRRFVVSKVVLLYQEGGDGSLGNWTRVWSHELSPEAKPGLSSSAVRG